VNRGLPSPVRPRLPLWARWALALGIAAVLAVALVVYVDHHNTDSLAPESPTAAVRANREAEIVVAQDQAPHLARLSPMTTGQAGFADVIRADMNRRIASGQIGGPLRRVSCRGDGSSARQSGFSCTAAAGGFNYAFVGVLDDRARRVTYCKRDPPPVPSENIPVSRRCTLSAR
jgi:hypothetical protein